MNFRLDRRRTTERAVSLSFFGFGTCIVAKYATYCSYGVGRWTGRQEARLSERVYTRALIDIHSLLLLLLLFKFRNRCLIAVTKGVKY